MAAKVKPTHGVLALLCVMYFITYVDRVNIGTAASSIQTELHLNNSELGFIFSAFAYPYLLFQIFGGWVGDHFGARRTLFLCALIWAVATILTGFVTGIVTLILARFLLGFGEGATFPTATRAMQHWTPASTRGFAQGLTHAFSRLGNAITPPLVAALILSFTWRGSFILLGLVSLAWAVAWVWYFRNDPKDHPGMTDDVLETLPHKTDGKRPEIPWLPLVRRMWPVTLTYFCYGWTLWLYLNWLPLFFKNHFHLDIKNSALFACGVFVAGVVGDTLGGIVSDKILHKTGNVRVARLGVVIFGFVGALISLIPPILFQENMAVVAICLSAEFFFAELVIGPMWSIPMDIAPKYSGTAAGLMNIGSAGAAIVSPVVSGLLIDWSGGDWFLPFYVSMGLLVIGFLCAFLMHPEKPMEPKAPPSDSMPLGETAVAR